MTEAELADFLDECPVFFHMAAEGAWPSIRRHGLLSASALLDRLAPEPSERRPLEEERRDRIVPLARPAFGRAVLRDQKTMTDAALRACLEDGLTPADWYRTLNARVFLWPSRGRLERLLSARSYAAHPHDVLEIDAASLVETHRPRIALAAINTGSTIR